MTNRPAHILLVEDEEKVARFVQKGLEAEQYRVTVVREGIQGEFEALNGPYDLIILDVLLPGKNGFQILKTIRAAKNEVPVLMLTARSATEDVVEGFESGADDYLAKPFVFDELLARTRSLLRRKLRGSTVIQVGDLQLDTVRHKAIRNGETIDLTSREYALLDFLMRNPNKPFSRQELAEQVWGYNFDPGTNIIDVYINHLRKKIDTSPARFLRTVRGKGYMLGGEDGAEDQS
ncbi:MAG TPA: response regulator transcription factor [Bacteroidota bacterium]